eukprot:scaffold9136_cov365-Alexandrium_tamarense.AAC.1
MSGGVTSLRTHSCPHQDIVNQHQSTGSDEDGARRRNDHYHIAKMNLHSRSIIAVTANVVALILPKTDAALEIIGSGYGRTGTDTTREALTILGYKTYHMREIIDNQLLSHVEVWKEAAETNCANIDSIKSIFEEGGFTAAVDYPEAMCWEQLSKAYPDAK